jgi:hypothetical protein
MNRIVYIVVDVVHLRRLICGERIHAPMLDDNTACHQRIGLSLCIAASEDIRDADERPARNQRRLCR